MFPDDPSSRGTARGTEEQKDTDLFAITMAGDRSEQKGIAHGP